MPLSDFQYSFDSFAIGSQLSILRGPDSQRPDKLANDATSVYPCLPPHHKSGPSSRPTDRCHTACIRPISSTWLSELLSRTSSSHLARRPLSCPAPPAPSSIKACQCGHWKPRSRVSLSTWRVLCVVSPVSSSAVQRSVSSTPCVGASFSIWSFTLLQPKRAWEWWTTPPRHSDDLLPGTTRMRQTLSWLVFAAICCLNFSLSVGEMPKACPPHTLTSTKTEWTFTTSLKASWSTMLWSSSTTHQGSTTHSSNSTRR